jgi:hypothetical protein
VKIKLSRQIFVKIQVLIFMKISAVGAELSHAHGRKDIDINVIKLIVAILFAILPMR